ncbi:MAG: amino acid adenylation domain-containing protein, partial [Rubrivivax sp.]
NRFANALRARGIGAGALVGLCLGRGPDLLPALLGVLKTGAAYVPLDPGFPADRLRYMAEDAGLRLVITESAHADKSGVSRAQQLRIDDDAASISAVSDHAVSAPADADAPAYVIYTSGSTGQPKGVVLPQRAVCNFLASMRRQPGLVDTDRLLAVTTLSFDIAVLELLLPLTCGARVVIAQREDAMDGEVLKRLIAEHGITAIQATPTTWHLMLDAGWRATPGFKALCGGEPLPPSLADQLLAQGVELWNMYGPTETTVWSTIARIQQAGQKITIGQPIANTQVWILDEQMKPCPIGTEGEICIGGAGVALGYFKRPELTTDRFVKDPFSHIDGALLYRTGDLGKWREDGSIEHLGRLDFQVKVRGYRIELGEIEARLAALPGVARTVVVAREDQPGDVALVAYAVPQAGISLNTTQLRDALRANLPDYMVPRTVVALDALPLLPNGKIDRKALPAPSFQAPVAASAAPTASATKPAAETSSSGDLAHTIAQTMAALLGRPSIDLNDNFFELGGHSLLAARLSAKLVEALGHRPGLRVIFESPTPAALAKALQGAAPATQQVTASQIPIRPDQSTAPLSLMQQRVWFLENLTPGTVVHNIPTGHRLLGELDVEAFNRAFQMLVQRQGVFRTVIERTPTGDRQRILDKLPFSLLPLEDLSSLPEAEAKASMQRTIAHMVEVPYDLEQGPLFTAKLFRISPQEHGLLFMAHHLIWDAWSFDLLYVDLPELYAACLAKREPQLAPLTVSYGDFADWHNHWMSGPELAQQTRHWCSKLTPLPPAIDLPLDHPRPAVMSGRGSSHQFNLPKDIADALRAQGQRHGRTLYVALLASYALVLSRVSQQNDFVVGTPVRGREQPTLEPLMGFFVNMLPLRMRFDPSVRFSDWLASIHDQVVESFSFPDVPFEHLVRELNVPRDNSRPPIHQVSFSYQDVRERPTRWGNVDHQRMATPLLGAAQDLSLWCVETRNHIEYVFTFNTDVLDKATVANIAARLESLLKQIVANPDLPLAAYDMVTPAERELMATWNNTASEFDRQACVHQLIDAQTARTPTAIALTQPGVGQVSYAGLNAQVNRLAHSLRARGIGRGALVGLCVERGIDMVVAQLACLKAGAAYVPLDPAYPADRLAYMAQDAKLALLISQSEWLHALNWPREQTLLLDIDAASIAAHSDAPLPADAAKDARPQDPAYVIYTSGSTGQPKGVVVPHGAVVNFLSSMAREPGLAAGDRLVAVTTLSFDIAVLELLLPLTVGAEIVLATRDQVLEGHGLRALLESHQATVMQATPTTWRMLIEAGWEGSANFKALVGGEALAADLAEQLLKRTGQLWNMYGPTETTVWSTCWRVTQPEQGIAIGRPIASTQVHILDDQQRPCPIGVPGEVYIGGDGVTLGYLHRPELTAERFIQDPFSPQAGAKLYRTGDRGRWRHDGQLEHLGRLDFQVKVRGHRIELGEIEAHLISHRLIKQAIVIVREDNPNDVRLVAYVVPHASMPSGGELRDHLRAHLPDYMLPQHYVKLDSIPLLPNGKVNRHALPVPTETLTTSSKGFVAPSSAAQLAVAEVWKRLLDISDVSVTDNFFDLGGHSLLAMRAVNEINRQLGSHLTVRQMIFETLGQLASAAAPNTPAEPAAIASAAPQAEHVPQAAAAHEAAPQRGWLGKLVDKLR